MGWLCLVGVWPPMPQRVWDFLSSLVLLLLVLTILVCQRRLRVG